MSFESPRLPQEQQGEVRKKFMEADEAEQIERFRNLKSLYEETKGVDPEREKFSNFYDNVHKYTDKFKLEGMDEKQVAQVTEFLKDKYLSDG